MAGLLYSAIVSESPHFFWDTLNELCPTDWDGLDPFDFGWVVYQRVVNKKEAANRKSREYKEQRLQPAFQDDNGEPVYTGTAPHSNIQLPSNKGGIQAVDVIYLSVAPLALEEGSRIHP